MTTATRAAPSLAHSVREVAPAPAPTRPYPSRRLLFALLAFVTLWAALSHAAPVARAQAADPTHLQTVRAEYGIILDAYVRPVDPAQLLTAAWSGATDALNTNGFKVTARLPRLSGDREQVFATFSAAWMTLASEVGDSIDMAVVAFVADDAMANSLNDDHTSFLPPDVYQSIQQELGGADATQIGLGVASNSRPPHIVGEVAPGGPAEQAGLKPGDTILSVNDVSVEALRGAAYLNTIDLPQGTTETVMVQRPGAGTLTLTAVSGPYLFAIFSAIVLPGGVGYMRLRSFVNPYTALQDGQNVVQELDAALASFESAGVTAWILDLRNNGGGSGVTNAAIAGRFLPDGKTETDTDARGHRSEGLVDGHPVSVQRPLAVLLNSNSASSSEVVASTLKEYGRATLVGGRSAGALGSAQIFPLPDGAGLEITLAQVTSGRYQTLIDTVGVPVDVEARNPTASDLAAGSDPGIEAAVAALAGQQPFTSPPFTDATLPASVLRSLLDAYEVTAAEVPLAPEIRQENLFGDYVINSYNEWNNWEGPGRDAFAARELPKQRGWQGAELQFFGETPIGASIVVVSDLYATAEGAAAAMAGTDFPDLLMLVTSPLQQGDQTIAYAGQWEATGLRQITWRHGRLLLTVAFTTVPGEETFDPLVTLAQRVEAHYMASPVAGQ